MEKNQTIHIGQQQQLTLQTLRQSLVPNYKNLNTFVQNQMRQILQILINKKQKKDKKIIQAISRSGVLEQSPLLRSHLWKIQLGTLSMESQTWVQNIQGNYRFYQDLVKKLFPKQIPDNIDQQVELFKAGKLQMPKQSNSKLDFDYQLWGQIVLDAKRTHSVLNFFKNQVSYTKLHNKKPTRHCDILGRLLYIWGKVNPRIRYVQGMNELLAPLYYLEFQTNSVYCESQVFFMFTSIMTFSIDMHMKQRDKTQYGILGRIQTLNRYLKVADYQIWQKLMKENVMPEHYSFRWLALLLGQQFQLDQILRIWDVLFSFDGPKRFLYLNCLCLAILKARKQIIMVNDMVGILPKLQKLKDLQVDQIIQSALKMYEKYSKVSIQKLYERLEQQNREFKQNREQQIVQPLKDNRNGEYLKKMWSYGALLKNTTSEYGSLLKSTTSNLFNSKWSYFRSPGQPETQLQPPKQTKTAQ